MGHHNYLRKGPPKTAAKVYKRGQRKVKAKKRFGRTIKRVVEF